jgi:hypothetical protein
MKTRKFLIMSLAVNLALLSAVVLLSREFFRLPDNTTAQVVYHFVTNSPSEMRNSPQTSH